MAPEPFQLPVAVATPGDVNRLLREVTAIDEHFLQLKLRRSGTPVRLPKISQLLDQTVRLNNLNLLQEEGRVQLKQVLQAVRQRSPVLHISFGADPSPLFLDKLMAWLRREIHPQVLITTGLQPTIGAGCIIRTANRSFDFTLAQRFAQQRTQLIDRLRAQPPVQPAAPAVQETMT